MSEKKKPAITRSVYMYAAVSQQGKGDVAFIEHTRKAVRDKITWQKNADDLRIRRARILLYES
jgi:hypothetical protein